MDTFLFFEPYGRRWAPRRDISSHGPLSFWDPWSTFAELDGPVWRPFTHVPGQQCLRGPQQEQQQQVKKAEPEKNEGFKLALDATGYKPEEVSVKLSDGVVTVRARHHEKTSGGLVTSSMVRRVRLPDNVDASALSSRLTREGQLVLEAPPVGSKEAIKAPEEKKAVEAAPAPEQMQVAEPVEKPQFQVGVDVSAFKPEEVSVKVDGGVVTVDAHREEKSDEGCSSMRMVRKFTLPPGVNPDLLKSRLTSSGQLMVEAPESEPPAKEGGEGAMETA
ncbi:heat shock protein beta-1-like [Amphibalanus amphitrite]|uniref:heat shock protein beta-1-like n=1 Tax=Amphibalanus amphitrite TaxID=1232801 RepID=UPI001C9071C0|nr:heat shock protein beta-1-like [Amphibalanus amphitrite]